MTKDEVKKLRMDSPESLQFLNNATKFYNLMMMYRCAIREIQTKLEVLDDEFSVENNRNPISFIKTRINLGTGGSYNRRKSYGNYRYADFHSTCIGILYYIPGVRISAPKKTTYKTSNENGCGRVCGGGNCVILYCAE